MTSPQWITLIKDGIVSKTPSFIHKLLMTAHLGKVGFCTLYDGESIKDTRIMELRSISNNTLDISFDPPLETHRGIYVDLDGDVHDVLIHFSSVKE